VRQLPGDQLTSHESVPEEGRVGRFSRGLERMPPAPSTLHRGRFSEGLEQRVETSRTRRVGRFDDGIARLRTRPPREVRGSFAVGIDADG
jgi:hypothetical protein